MNGLPRRDPLRGRVGRESQRQGACVSATAMVEAIWAHLREALIERKRLDGPPSPGVEAAVSLLGETLAGIYSHVPEFLESLHVRRPMLSAMLAVGRVTEDNGRRAFVVRFDPSQWTVQQLVARPENREVLAAVADAIIPTWTAEVEVEEARR